VFRQLRALLMPVIVVGVIPAALLFYDRPALDLAPKTLAAGLALVAGGLWLMVQTVRLLIVDGQGTLAPWDPTQRLVVRGIYRHVRNPMITGVIAIAMGEAAVFASGALLAWAALVTLVNVIYIPLLEEPGLVQRFGADYETYRRNVPRWLPRRAPWGGPGPEGRPPKR
jgi:protein-S-isoprenylcysteine O-methyltransferase Ste14